MGTDGVLLGAWAQAENPERILDVGTGSGLIALMLAQRFPQSQITGIELDESSAIQARSNAKNSPFANRIEIVQDDFLQSVITRQFDLIVSNPPFFKGNTSTGKRERDRARHEEHLPQGKFLEIVKDLLSEEGQLAVILPKAEAIGFVALAEKYGLYPCRLTKVYGQPEAEDKRWLMEFSFQNSYLQKNQLTVRSPEGNRSEEYKMMTKDFYL